KRIEDGINQVQCSVAEYPEAITYLLEQYDRVEAEEARLSDLIRGSGSSLNFSAVCRACKRCRVRSISSGSICRKPDKRSAPA
ncbi:hypothetical protein MJL81_34035, partial [Salmonella enterica subsp. enterica serovar Anatum]|nr:hypothetical protein [Salmonella enterica subsp. enterica serovar Anatum]